MTGITGGVRAVCVLPDGVKALSGSDEAGICLWDLETGEQLRRLEGHEGEVQAVAALPDRRRAISGSIDRTIRLWDLDTGAELRRLEERASGTARLEEAVVAYKAALEVLVLAGADYYINICRNNRDRVQALLAERDHH